MIVRFTARRAALAFAMLLPIVCAAHGARADAAAANACAAKLPKDAKTIFAATLPKVTPGADLRAVLTSSARSLAISGKIDRGTARDSATAAGECLKLTRT